MDEEVGEGTRPRTCDAPRPQLPWSPPERTDRQACVRASRCMTPDRGWRVPTRREQAAMARCCGVGGWRKKECRARLRARLRRRARRCRKDRRRRSVAAGRQVWRRAGCNAALRSSPGLAALPLEQTPLCRTAKACLPSLSCSCVAGRNVNRVPRAGRLRNAKLTQRGPQSHSAHTNA